MNSTTLPVSSSFRDPSGFVFIKDSKLYRQINTKYKEHYDAYMQSGLYEKLLSEGLVIQHKECSKNDIVHNDCYKIIEPEYIKNISYPYEWCFSQLKDAAELTLKIQKIALEYNMTLKDASAYNVQFVKGMPVHFDTLSFEKYSENKPWAAYKQFCQHFIAPLFLMKYVDARLNKLLMANIDGIPLDLASSMLPGSSFFNLNAIMHIHLQAKSINYFSNKPQKFNKYGTISKKSILTIISSLEGAVKGIKLNKKHTEWDNYYANTNYSKAAFGHKTEIVNRFLDKINPSSICDVAGNSGVFSKIAARKGIDTICFDIDYNAIDDFYNNIKLNKINNILPLVNDITNPCGGIGWENNERQSLSDRLNVDAVMALALIHHLAIANNIPFDKIASYFQKSAKNLIIEFVPKNDSQVQRMLSTREDIFENYSQDIFEKSFSKYFEIKEAVNIIDSNRIMYLLVRKYNE